MRFQIITTISKVLVTFGIALQFLSLTACDGNYGISSDPNAYDSGYGYNPNYSGANDPSNPGYSGYSGSGYSGYSGSGYSGYSGSGYSGNSKQPNGSYGQNLVAHDASRIGWIISARSYSLSRMQSSADDTMTKEFFAKGKVYYIVNKPSDLDHLPAGVIPTMKFKNIADWNGAQGLQNAIQSKSIDPRIKAIVYDLEGWRLSPLAEQQNPTASYRLASELVHPKYELIASPALDLVSSVKPAMDGNEYTEFLALNLPGQIAKFADLYEIQDEMLETTIHSRQGRIGYLDFVAECSQLARAANPDVLVYAGISTDLAGESATAQQLLTAILSTDNLVNGYWLRIPGPWSCGDCQPQPQLASELIELLATDNF